MGQDGLQVFCKCIDTGLGSIPSGRKDGAEGFQGPMKFKTTAFKDFRRRGLFLNSEHFFSGRKPSWC